MARKHAGTYTLPENPHWLEFDRSDGDSSLLPKNTKKIIDSDGQVNFMRPVPLDESLAIMWRVGIGGQLAVRMGLPAGPSYVLKTFPEGYHLYDHNKGPAKTPRHDPYLCGSVHVNRFRSVNEFIPHALWLMQDPTMNRANCSCKYCTKQPQRIISDTMGLSTHSGRRSTSVAGVLPLSVRIPRQRREGKEARPRPPPTRPYAAVRRAPKPPRVIVGPEQCIVPERDLDVRAALVSGEGRRPRWFRKGELLWCHLEVPIRGRDASEDIQFWPGIVEDFHVKTQAVPNGAQDDSDTNMDHLYQEAADESPAPGESAAAGPSKATTPPLEAEGSVPWKVQQWYVYKMKLLGTSQYYFATDHQVLPYLAYAPSDQILDRVRGELSEFLQTVPIDEMDRDLDLMHTFDPLEPEAQGDSPDAYYEKYKRAAAPYTLAIQAAANVAQYWLPTDEWECKFTIPPLNAARPSASQAPAPTPLQAPVPSPSQPPPVPSSSQASQPPSSLSQSHPQTLHALIAQSLAQNASRPPPATRPNGSASAHAPESISTHGHRLPRTSTLPQTVVQTRFQGLWWGTERIWTDELVRLKLARCQFAPKGTDRIRAPAGPSPSTLESMRGNPEAAAADPQRLGASEKGLFMRLEGIFLVDVPGAHGGFTKECRASGMVYELVDDDWVEEDEGNKEQAAPVQSGDAARPEGESPAQGPNGAPSFMSQLSPLKPPPLPNPDPTVPMEETATAVLAQTPPDAAAKAHNKDESKMLNVQLSHPVLSTPYPLPPATKGFRFRPILAPDHEIVISLSLISGRYYPGLFHHPLMAPTVEHALSLSAEDGGVYHHRHLWAMEGLLPGIHQSMDPRRWHKSRMSMFQDADRDARERFRERWEESKMARLHPTAPQEKDADAEMQWEGGASNEHAPMEVD
ncbi:hypothetical protein BD413DRAFT_569971 [Trametes elegans]|nr:hypothetical protein BD413DRAFT_569971 [Trametes elegans]